MHTPEVLILLACALALCAAAPGEGGCSCTDVAPPGEESCEQQRDYGKCERTWMMENGFCSRTCGHCSCDQEDVGGLVASESDAQENCVDCLDIPPPEGLSCEEQAQFGKCDREWMEGFCMKSCNKCSCTSSINGAGIGAQVVAESTLEVPAETEPVSDDATQTITTDGSTTDEMSVENNNSDSPDEAIDASGAELPTTEIKGEEEDGAAGILETSSTEGSVSDIPQVPSSTVAEEGEGLATTSVSGLQDKVNTVRSAVKGDLNGEDTISSTAAGESLDKSDVPEPEVVGGEQGSEVVQGEPGVNIDQGTEGEAVAPGNKDEGSLKEKDTEGETPSIAPAEKSGVSNECQSVMEIISNNPDLTSLATAMQTAKIDGSLDDTAVDITFFAPSNEAFKLFTELLGEDAQKIMESPEALRLVLSNHVSRLAASADDIVEAESLTTLANIEDTPGSLKIFRAMDGAILIDGHANRAAVVTPDIQACNSVIHIIDAVLPPVDFSEIITATK